MLLLGATLSNMHGRWGNFVLHSTWSSLGIWGRILLPAFPFCLVALSRAKRELFEMDILHVALTAVKLEHVNVSLICWY